MLSISIKKWVFNPNDHCWIQELNPDMYINNQNCKFCANEMSDISRIVGSDGDVGLSVGECEICGHIQKTRRVDFEKLNAHFGEKWLHKRQDRSFLPNDGVFNQLKTFISPSSKILEIGCGSGLNLKPFQDFGCEVFGFDPSESEIEIAKFNGVNNVSVDSAESYIEKNKTLMFDVIFMRDVFQFLDNPFSTIAKYLAMLSPNGVFMSTNKCFSKTDFITACHHAVIPNHPTLTVMEKWCFENNLQVIRKKSHPVQVIARKAEVLQNVSSEPVKTIWTEKVKKELFSWRRFNPITRMKKINKFRRVKIGSVKESNANDLVEFVYDSKLPPAMLK